MRTGRFVASGAVRKCSSMAWKPASISLNCSGPSATIVDRPMAESIEYRPPTQSQNPNMLAVSIPNSDTRSAFGGNGHEVLGDRPTCRLAELSTQSRAEVALVRVSSVPKVFDDTMNRVSSADRSLVASTKSVESTLETKRKVRSRRV